MSWNEAASTRSRPYSATAHSTALDGGSDSSRASTAASSLTSPSGAATVVSLTLASLRSSWLTYA